MNRSAPHPVLAWCLDVWLVLSLVLAARDVFGSDVAPPGHVFWSISGVVLILVVPAVYHAIWSASARVLSFGEHVFGRVIVEGTKIWLNPYGTSRTLLYGCAMYGLFVRFSVSPRQHAGSFDVPMELLLLAITAGSMIVLGRGRAWALLGILPYRAFERTLHMPSLSFDSIENFAWFIIGVHGETIFFAMVCVAVAHNYSAARGRLMATEVAA